MLDWSNKYIRFIYRFKSINLNVLLVISKRNNIRFEDSPIRRTRLRHIILVQCEPCLVCVYVCELVCTRYMYVYVDAARLKDRSIAQKSLSWILIHWITCLSIHKCYRQICMTTYTSINKLLVQNHPSRTCMSRHSPFMIHASSYTFGTNANILTCH